MLASYYEAWSRTIAEGILFYLCYSLPTAMNSFIAADNVRKSFATHAPNHVSRFFHRPLPKGSLGCQLSKPMHDDKNGVESMGVWRCLREDLVNPVELVFKTTELSWSIRSSTNRFAIFKGMLGFFVTVQSSLTKIKCSRWCALHWPALFSLLFYTGASCDCNLPHTILCNCWQ